jgi:hypothetical protein
MINQLFNWNWFSLNTKEIKVTEASSDHQLINFLHFIIA